MESSLNHLIGWSESTRGDIPHPLTGPSITISPLPAPHPPTAFLFGGKFVQTRRLTSEMWALDLTTRVWERVDAGDGPGPRYFHSMDTWEDKLVCFGGMSDSEPTSVHDDIWFFDCTARKWLPEPSPEPPIVQDPRFAPSARYAHLSAVSRGQLVVSGGQHENNTWVYEINVYDLKRRVWISRTEQPEAQGLHSKGAYRSVATSSKQRVILPKNALSYAINEEGEGGDIWCYSNYDFAKVRRELDVFSPSDIPPHPSTKHRSPPSYAIHDLSHRMSGSSQPPGLRFPTGGIVGNHFILCGLYLASTSAAYSVYALNLDTLAWRHLEPAVLATGSWNRAVLWPEQAKLLVFGNRKLDLSEDYGRRAVNLDNMAVIALGTYGIYAPPRLTLPLKAQEVGLAMLEEHLVSDFEIICEDGRRIPCSRAMLSERWSWFAKQESSLADQTSDIVSNPPIESDQTLLTFSPASLRPTHLHLSEPFAVCIAFLQYLYTLTLSRPVQLRGPTLASLLFLAKQYDIPHLASLVSHALHDRLDMSNAVGIYEIATLGGMQSLQVRALGMIHAAKNASTSTRSHRTGPAASQADLNGAGISPVSTTA